MEKTHSIKKPFLVVLIIALSISALIGIFIFLLGDFGDTEARILFTTLAIGAYSLTGLCCAALYEKRKSGLLAPLGMIISVAGLLYTVALIWELSSFMVLDDSLKVLVILIVLAFSTAHSSLLLLITPARTLVTTLLAATILFIAIVALMLITLVFDTVNENVGEFYYRLLGVFAILDVLGTIVTPITNKIYSSQN